MTADKVEIEYEKIEFPHIKPGIGPQITIPCTSKEGIFYSGPSSVRFQVFVDEQNCDPANEIDEYDSQSIHYAAYISPQTTSLSLDSPLLTPSDTLQNRDISRICVGTVRVFKPYEDAKYVKLGRLAVLKEWRGFKIGVGLVGLVEKTARDSFCADFVVLHAQKSKEGWYDHLGYSKDESAGEWEEEG